MYIRYNNTRNECNQVYRYLYKKKISLLKLRVVVYSILGGVGMYMAMYTLVDYIYKIFFSILFTTILFIAGLKQMTKQINKEVDTIINDELIELVVEKNFIKIKSKEKEYSLLINKEENYRFLEICRNIVLVNKNSKIVFSYFLVSSLCTTCTTAFGANAKTAPHPLIYIPASKVFVRVLKLYFMLFTAKIRLFYLYYIKIFEPLIF